MALILILLISVLGVMRNNPGVSNRGEESTHFIPLKLIEAVIGEAGKVGKVKPKLKSNF